METTEKSEFRSGFVSIVGRPNAGKSTLINALVGTRVAIVADKPQTTRTSVQGVWNTDGAQVVFIDTPGIHKADTLYNRRMMREVRAALGERDLLIYIVDATRHFTTDDEHAISMVSAANTPAFLVLNKIDKLDTKEQLLALIDRFREKFEFLEYLPVSAQKGEGLDKLRQLILERIPEGPAYFPPDQITDQPERFLAAELIREKILHETRQEVPHSVAVFIEHWEDVPDEASPRLTRMSATIVVERAGQKAIIIGAKGTMLKQIGTRARRDIEAMLGRKVFLEMFVKVREGWRENPSFLNELDWRQSMSGPQAGGGAAEDEDGPTILPQ